MFISSRYSKKNAPNLGFRNLPPLEKLSLVLDNELSNFNVDQAAKLKIQITTIISNTNELIKDLGLRLELIIKLSAILDYIIMDSDPMDKIKNSANKSGIIFESFVCDLGKLQNNLDIYTTMHRNMQIQKFAEGLRSEFNL